MATTKASPFSLEINSRQSPVFRVPPSVSNLSLDTTGGEINIQIGDLSSFFDEKIKEGRSTDVNSPIIIHGALGTNKITVSLLGENDNFGYNQEGVPFKKASSVAPYHSSVMFITPIGSGRWIASGTVALSV
jgi:hypothetical protein